ncbi:unnamed protein product [Closterium sp. Naga37s-1]|nr:unnamed protein product [Closterium sp. Naga37s-1]
MQFQVVPHGARPLATAETLCAMTRAELVAELRSLQADHEKYRQEGMVWFMVVAFQKDLLASVGQSVICTDLAGTITYWNKAAEAMYGWREEEAVGRSIIEVTPADTTVQQAGEIFAALTRGDVWRGEFLVRRRDGSPFHAMVTDTPILDSEGKLVGVIGVSADISDLKRKEGEIRALNAALEQRVEERTEQLMRSNEALKSEIEQHLRAQDHLRRCIRDLEASRDKISQQSTALERLVGQLREARVEAESANRLKSRFLASMSHEIRTPMNGVLGMTRLLLSTPLQEEQRQFVDTIRSSGDALLTILNDILDLSKIEAGELELEHRDFDLCRCLEDAVSLLAIRAMEKGVAVVSFVEPNVPRVVRSDSARLRQILVNLISNAIKFTERGEVEVTVSATRLPGSSEQHMPELLKETAKQQTDGGRGDMRMEGSRGGMHEEEQEQDEAKEEGLSGMSKGGDMSPGDGSGESAHSGFAVWGKALSSRRRWRGEETQGMERHGVHCIAVSVRDTGIGIPKERMKRLFKPFSQVDASMTRKYGGTGLGLAISHQLVGMLGGRIWAESDGQGRGSTFRFYITAPALPFDLHTPVEAQQKSPAPPASAAAASLGLLSQGYEADAATAASSAVPALHPSLPSPAAAAASAVPLTSAAAAGLLRKRKREVEPLVAAAVTQGPSQGKRYAAAACCCSSSCQCCCCCCCCCCWKDGALTSEGETLRNTEGESGRAADIGSGRQDGNCASQTRCSSSGGRSGCRGGGEGCAPLGGRMERRKGGTEEERGDPGETATGDVRSEEEVLVRGRESDRWEGVGEGVGEGEGEGVCEGVCEGVSEGVSEVEAAVSGWERARRRAEGRSALVVLPHASTRRMVCRHLASLGFRVGEASSGEEADRVIEEGVRVLGEGCGVMSGEEGRRGGSGGDEGRTERREFVLSLVSSSLPSSLPFFSPRLLSLPLLASPHSPLAPLTDAPPEDWLVQRARGRAAAKACVDAAGFQSGLAQQHPLKILLAEDNLVNQKVATKMLGRMGYTCHVAVNGAEVLQALQKDSFDLVFMDVQMPVMDGIEATQRITQMWPPSQRPKIFAMTANVLETDRAMCMQAGMDGFISKPVSVHELVRAVEFSSPAKR